MPSITVVAAKLLPERATFTWDFYKVLRAEKLLAKEASRKERGQVAWCDGTIATEQASAEMIKAKIVKLGEKLEKREASITKNQLKKLDIVQASTERIAAQNAERIEKPKTAAEPVTA